MCKHHDRMDDMSTIARRRSVAVLKHSRGVSCRPTGGNTCMATGETECVR